MKGQVWCGWVYKQPENQPCSHRSLSWMRSNRHAHKHNTRLIHLGERFRQWWELREWGEEGTNIKKDKHTPPTPQPPTPGKSRVGFGIGKRMNEQNLNFWMFIFLVEVYNFWNQRKRNQPNGKEGFMEHSLYVCYSAENLGAEEVKSISRCIGFSVYMADHPEPITFLRWHLKEIHHKAKFLCLETTRNKSQKDGQGDAVFCFLGRWILKS